MGFRQKEVDNMADLASRISELERREKIQTQQLRDSFHELADSVSPKNLIRKAVRSVVSTPGLKTTALDTAVSVAAGNLGKRLIARKSAGLLRKAAGTAAKFIITNIVRNKMPVVKQKIQPHISNSAVRSALK